MSQIITAIYEAGVLKPLEPLFLPEHQKIQIQIIEDVVDYEIEKGLQELVYAGILTLPRKNVSVSRVSDEERLRIAHILGQAGKSLSEIIIEDRGER